MPFIQNVKLGRPRQEVVFTAFVDEIGDLTISVNWVTARVETAVGEVFHRVRRRLRPNYDLRGQDISEGLVEQLESLRLIADTPLAFVFASARKVKSERLITDGLQTVTLSNTPMALLAQLYKALGGTDTDIVTVTGVHTDYHANGGQISTNHFAAGTYDWPNLRLNLSSSPGAIGTPVFVNWQYNGSLVNINQFRSNAKGGEVGSSRFYDLQIALESA
jgi:hypothetical protein